MPLPLFDEPAPVIPRIGIDSPLYFAFWTGFREGADGQSRSYRYDEDEDVNRFYQDGHRIGALFETRQRRKTEWKEPSR